MNEALTRLLNMHWANLLDFLVLVVALPEVSNLIPKEYLSLYIAVRAAASMYARMGRESTTPRPPTTAQTLDQTLRG